MSELKLPSINQVALSGRLVQDPDFRLGDNGIPRLSGRLAVNRSFRDRDGQWREETSYVHFILWQKMAQYYAEKLHKGTPVFLTGRLNSHNWKDAEDQPHTLIEVQVRNLQILERQATAAESAEEDPEQSALAA